MSEVPDLMANLRRSLETERARRQERTSRALAQASTPYQQSGARVDILAPKST